MFKSYLIAGLNQSNDSNRKQVFQNLIESYGLRKNRLFFKTNQFKDELKEAAEMMSERIKYRPGGVGYYEAKTHFEILIEHESNNLPVKKLKKRKNKKIKRIVYRWRKIPAIRRRRTLRRIKTN